MPAYLQLLLLRLFVAVLSLYALLFSPISNASPANVIPITAVELNDGGTVVTQTASGQGGPSASNSNAPVSITTITINDGGTSRLLNIFALTGIEIKNISIPSGSRSLYFASDDGTRTDANNASFSTAMQNILSTTDIRDFIAYEDNGHDGVIDITYQDFQLNNNDFLVFQERAGNSSFSVYIVDKNGSQISGSNSIDFVGGDMNWNTGYDAGDGTYAHDTQEQYFGVIKVSDFGIDTSVTPVGGFRISTQGGDPKVFGASDDPFDAVTLVNPDYGDAPTSGTAPNGSSNNNYGEASHTIVNGYYIGATSPDSEPSYQASDDAGKSGNSGQEGDDHDGNNDEDTFSNLRFTQGDSSATLVVPVAETTAGTAYLQTWIDWNGDGDFSDTVDGISEQISINAQDNITTVPGRTDDTDTTAGQISLEVSVPSSALIGQTFARLRWSTDVSLDSTTAASNGEVEDYAVTIEANIVVTPPTPTGDPGVCWAISDDTSEIYKFALDTSNPQPPTSITTSRTNNGEGLAWRPSTNELYMWDGTTTYVLNADSGADVRSFTSDLSPGSYVEGATFYVNPSTLQEELWLTVEDYVSGNKRNDRYLIRIDPDTGTSLSSAGPMAGGYIDSGVDYGKDTGGLAIDPNSKQFWVTNDGLQRGLYPMDDSTATVGSGTLFSPSVVDGETLAFANDGYLYTESDEGPSSDRYIWRITDVSTGSITRAAGPFPGSGDVEGMACDGGAEYFPPAVTPGSPGRAAPVVDLNGEALGGVIAGWSHHTPTSTLNADFTFSDPHTPDFGTLSFSGANPSVVNTSASTAETLGSSVSRTFVGDNTVMQVSGVTQSTYTDAKGAEDYVEYTITTTGSLSADAVIDQLGYGTHQTNGGSNPATAPYKFTVEVSDNNFTTSDILVLDKQVAANSGAYAFLTYDVADYKLSPSTTYTFRVYLYDDDNGDGNVIWDDFAISVVDDPTDYTNTFTQGGAAVDIADAATAVEDADDTNMTSGSIVLTNAFAGDFFVINGTTVSNGSTGTINGLSYTVTESGGQITIALSGSGTKATYATTISQIQFDSSAAPINTTDRIIHVTTNDGTYGSNTAISTIDIIAAPSLPSVDQCDAAASGNLDTDGDNVSNICDLDDDNDGIPDDTEGLCSTDSYAAGWYNNSPAGTFNQDGRCVNLATDSHIYGNAHDTSIISSASPYTLGSGLIDNTIGSVRTLANVSETTLAAAKTANDYLEYEFTTTAALGSNMTLGGFAMADSDENGEYYFSIEISSDNFSTSQKLVSDFHISSTHGRSAFFALDKVEPSAALMPSTSYKLRAYIYGASNPSTNVIFDDLNLGFCQSQDSDSDGIPDYIDLDSDNDGIPDNVEAQTSQGYIKPNGIFDSNGVDTAYNGLPGGGLTPINTDSNDAVDYLDTDSDDDNSFDIVESGLANNDSNNDGMTDSPVGSNGLDNDSNIEAADNYSDVNGLAHNGSIFTLADTDNDVADDGSDAAPMGTDFDFRDNQDDSPSLPSIDQCDAAASGNLDTDNDNVSNICDFDDDNDGIPDETEGCNNAPFIGRTVEAHTALSGAPTLSTTESLIIPNGSNRALIVEVGVESPTPPSLTVTYGGTTLTALTTPAIRGLNSLHTYYLSDAQIAAISTASTTGEIITATDANGTNNAIVIYATVLNNIDQSGLSSVTAINETGTNCSSNNYTFPAVNANAGDYLFHFVTTGLGENGNDDQFTFNTSCGTEIADVGDQNSNVGGTSLVALANSSYSCNVNIVNPSLPSCRRPMSQSFILSPAANRNSTCERDTDNDSIFDHLDLDADNDGIPDNVEAQTSQGYIKPNGIFDSNGVDTAYNGLPGGGLTPINTDSNDAVDYLDTDSDDDNSFDIVESGLANNDSNNDGMTDSPVGSNGLDNDSNIEAADNYSDVNGLAHNGSIFTLADTDNDVADDGSDAAPMGTDFDFRDNQNNALTPFTCDNTFYMSNRSEVADGNNDSGANWLHEIDISSPTASYSSIGSGYVSNDGGYNALAYNPTDNFLYGIYRKNLIKIDSTGQVTDLGEVTGINDTQYYAGSFDLAGAYYVSGDAGSDTSHLYKIDITTKSVVSTIPIVSSGGGITPSTFWDMSIDSTGNYFYMMLIKNGVNTDGSGFLNDRMARINISTGEITPFGPTHEAMHSYTSLIFSDSAGRFFIEQNEGDFYEVNPITGNVFKIFSGNALSFYNDGAHCPLSTFAPVYDYSDAPANYGNAIHTIDSNIQLGTLIDAETNTIASANADADGADDDGITIGGTTLGTGTLTQGQTLTVVANVTGSSGYLQGWIDFNNNDTFEAGEQIAINAQDNITTVPGRTDDSDSTGGQISINFTVPAGAVTGQTFARFRWSTDVNLDATATASDGEVEDYTVTIQPAAVTYIPPTTSCKTNWYYWNRVNDSGNPSRFNPIYHGFSKKNTNLGVDTWYENTSTFSNSYLDSDPSFVLPEDGTPSVSEVFYGLSYYDLTPGIAISVNITDLGIHDAHAIAAFDSNGDMLSRFPSVNRVTSSSQYYVAEYAASHPAIDSEGIPFIDTTWSISNDFPGEPFSFTVPADGKVYLHRMIMDESWSSDPLAIDLCATNSLSGIIFEDINYGGGAGRDQATAAGVGVNGVTVELYDNTGTFVATTTTANDGSNDGAYTFNSVIDGDYYIRVVNSTVTSTRTGSDGSESGVQTFRTDGTTPTINEVGGRDTTVADGGAYDSGNPSTLDTSTFLFSGGTLDTIQAQSIQAITVAGAGTSGIDFGFNFDTIVNTNDSGQGSFRQFIVNANLLDNTGLDQEDSPAGRNTVLKEAEVETSIFEIPGTGVHTIANTSGSYDQFTDRVQINGYTQNGSSFNTTTNKAPIDAVVTIELDGTNAGSGVDGLYFTTGSSNSIISGLSIINYDDDGIDMTAASTGNKIQGNFIGVLADGTTRAGQKNDGVSISSSSNIIGGSNAADRNIVSGNAVDGGAAGILVSGASANNNLIQGNYTGVGRDGVTAVPNQLAGIYLLIGDNNTVTDNVASGNDQRGILLNAGSSDNNITNNYVGVDYTGTIAVPNNTSGIQILRGENNIVGGSDPTDRNLVSGNTQHGINISIDAHNNTITGNYIGTDISGENALPNTLDGVNIDRANGNTVGGLNPNQRNIIAGNTRSGVLLNLADNTTLLGNYIGVDVNGTVALPNQYHGVTMEGGSDVQIGDGTADGRNILSGNAWSGINTMHTTNLSVLGNYLGLDTTGTVALGNGSVNATADGLSVGGTVNGLLVEGNVMSGQAVGDSPNGMELFNTSSNSMTIRNNIFGLDAAGTTDLGNSWHGVQFAGGDSSAAITNLLIEGNTFAGNGRDGLALNHTVQGGSVINNRMGTAADGLSVIANDRYGLYLGTSNGNPDGPQNVSIGDGSDANRNIVAGNAEHGVYIVAGQSLTLNNNRIGELADETAAGNALSGVLVLGGTDNLIQNNRIAHNGLDGVSVEGAVLNTQILTNSLFANTQLGIDLDTDSVNINDSGDADTGSNDLLNFPQFTQTLLDAGNLTLSGCAPTGATIELFEADVSPTSGSGATAGDNQFSLTQDYGEGETYLATFVEGISEDSVTTPVDCATITDADNNDATGMSPFQWTFTLPAGVVIGDQLTATATLAGTGTSEFSAIATVSAGKALSGIIFEDINYGGGAGRDQATASGMGVNGVMVELYDSTGAFVATTTTANDGSTDGAYTFEAVTDGDYYVRVVNNTVTSTRAGSDGSEQGVQTFRTDSTTAVTNEVGGRVPATSDTGSYDAGSPSTLNTTTFAFSGGTLDTAQAQSIQPLTMAGADISGIDFGFNFDTIVNTNDSGQGSLRQFILNSNLLTGEASLAQAGQTAGWETSIFMVPNADLNAGVATIALNSTLPLITGANTAIDGGTQTSNIGNTNPGVSGTGGTVGVDNLALPQYANPEVEIDGNDYSGLIVDSSGEVLIARLAIYDTDAASPLLNKAGVGLTSASLLTIENAFIGPRATGTDPGTGERLGRTYDDVGFTTAPNVIFRNNLFAYSDNSGLHADKTGGRYVLTGSELHHLAMNNTSQDAVDAGGVWTATGNLMHNNGNAGSLSHSGGAGFELGAASNDQVSQNSVVENNTLRDNFGPGIRLRNTVTDTQIRKNVIHNNRFAGVQLQQRAAGLGVDAVITQNSIFSNDEVGIDISHNTSNGSPDQATLNDANDTDTGPNSGLNFPQFVKAIHTDSALTINGCAPTGSIIELFEADVSPTAPSNGRRGDNRLGMKQDYGEGEVYLATLTEGIGEDTVTTPVDCATLTDMDGNNATGMSPFQWTIPVPAGIVVDDTLTATATRANSTSEFSATVIVTSGVSVSGRVFNDTNADGNNDTAETGISELPVVLYDTINGTCASTRTDGDGNYRFTGVLPSTYQVYEASQETVPTPQNCDPAQARDPSGYLSTTDNVSTTLPVINTNVTDIDFGDVTLPAFTADNTGDVLPGNVTFYAHTFTPPANGSVDFTLSANDPAGWSSLLYADADCSGDLNGSESDVALNTALATTAATDVCLIHKVFAPADASMNQQSVITLTADFTYGNGATRVANQTLINEDITSVSGNPVTGEGKLELIKTVENITQGTPETETQNMAKPGDILQYRITYRNTGTAPLTDIDVNDTVPAFTLLEGGSVACTSTPATLSCLADAANDPDISWSFSGQLEAGAEGFVSYRITVE